MTRPYGRALNFHRERGRYSVRVIAYNHNEVLDRFETARAGSDEEFAAALVDLRRLDPETAERYRIQLWPVKRRP